MNHFATNYTTEPVSTTEKPFEADDSKYLIIPLVVIIIIMLLSVLVSRLEFVKFKFSRVIL